MIATLVNHFVHFLLLICRTIINASSFTWIFRTRACRRKKEKSKEAKGTKVYLFLTCPFLIQNMQMLFQIHIRFFYVDLWLLIIISFCHLVSSFAFFVTKAQFQLVYSNSLFTFLFSFFSFFGSFFHFSLNRRFNNYYLNKINN